MKRVPMFALNVAKSGLDRSLPAPSVRAEISVWERTLTMVFEGRFNDMGSIAAKDKLRTRRNAASAIAGQAKVWFVRKADIGVHCSEGLLCSLSFESERYGSQAYHVDDRAS